MQKHVFGLGGTYFPDAFQVAQPQPQLNILFLVSPGQWPKVQVLGKLVEAVRAPQGVGQLGHNTEIISCFGPTERAAGVYHRESRSGKYRLTYAEAKAVCEYEGGHLATYQQLEAARKIGSKKITVICFSHRLFIMLPVLYFHECYELWDWETCKLPGFLPKSHAISPLSNRA